MNRPSDTPPTTTPHDARPASHEEWELRLQDWLDGVATDAEALEVQRHMASCAHCLQLVEDLRRLDEQLVATVPADPALTAKFDETLFARIDAEEATRERARKAARKSQPDEELAQLRRTSRTMLVRVLGAAGVIIAALAWLVASGFVPFLSPATIALTIAGVTPLQWLSIGLVGGAVSLALSYWVQQST